MRLSTFLLFLFPQTQESHNHVIRVITPSSHSFLKEREYICFKIFSEYKIKQNSTWRKLFAIQFALQSLAPKSSSKSTCWETESYATWLTVTSESNNTGSPDLLGTQSHKIFKNIQKSKHSRSTLLAISFFKVFFTILHFKEIEYLRSWL